MSFLFEPWYDSMPFFVELMVHFYVFYGEILHAMTLVIFLWLQAQLLVVVPRARLRTKIYFAARHDIAFHLDGGLGGRVAESWNEPVCSDAVSFHLDDGLWGRTSIS